jgi:phosphoribosylformylglycinamidine cyclo-ligase
VLEKFRPRIHGMIHCSGGGQTKVLKFVNNLHIIKDNLFELPPLFRMIHDSAGNDWDEMYEVYNMGHRFEIYTTSEFAEGIIKISTELGVDAKVVGHVETFSGHKLTIQSSFGTFTY